MESYKDVVVMVGVQCIGAGFAIFSKFAFLDGLSPQVYIVYRQVGKFLCRGGVYTAPITDCHVAKFPRQVLATLVIAPFAISSRRKRGLTLCLDLKTLGLIFVAALIGLTANQIAFYEAIDLASATIVSALSNLTTAATFVLTVIVGLEMFDMWSLRGGAKILGTIVCVGGATAVSLLKGPILLASVEDSSWILGCLLAFASCWCWATWMVLQVSITKKCPDDLYSTFITCLFASVQLIVIAMLMERRAQDWKLNTTMEYVACIFSGVGSSLTIFGQAWCISRRGPVFFATFNPLSTVVVAIIGAIFLNESIYLGSFLGSVAIIMGLYMVLWGKANDQVKDIVDDNLEESLMCLDDNLLNLEEEQHLQHRSP